MKLDAVAAFAEKLPGVTIGARWGNKTWRVGDRGFAWERPFSKADLARFGAETPPAGPILAVMVEKCGIVKNPGRSIASSASLASRFNGYAAVLIELRRARAKDVRAVVGAAHALVLEARPKRPRGGKKARSPAG